tara:strand:+ start:1405 stop:4404 length:3000 start_codon:yes stop_codon:yes gene_type:complete
VNKTQKEILASSEEDIMTPEEWEFATDKFKDIRKEPKMKTATRFKQYRNEIHEGVSGPTRMEIQKFFDKQKGTQRARLNKTAERFNIRDVIVNAKGTVVGYKISEDEVDEKHGGPHYAGSRHKKIERDKYRKRKTWSAMQDDNDPELEEGTVLQITDVDKWTTEIYKGLKAGWKSVAKSTLGGDENVAIMIKVTVEPEKDWPNKILHNASFGMIRIATDGTMEMFASGHKIKNMRKTKVKSAKDVVSKINKWLSTIDVQEVYSEGKSAYDKEIAAFLAKGGTIKKLKVSKKDVEKVAKQFRKKYKTMQQKEIELDIKDKLEREKNKEKDEDLEAEAKLKKKKQKGDREFAFGISRKGGSGAGRGYGKRGGGPIVMGEEVTEKDYDALKKGDIITIDFKSSMSSGKATFKVTAKNVVNKGKVGKVTLKDVKRPGGVKFYLYKRGNKVSLAQGDMAASVVKYTVEHLELTEAKILKPGTKVRVPHPAKGKGMVTGKIVRYDKGGGGYSPFYVVDIGEYKSEKIPAHKIQTEEIQGNSVTMREGYEKAVLLSLEDEGIDGYFDNGKVVVSKRDVKRAKAVLDDDPDIRRTPKIVGEAVTIFEVLKSKDKSVIDSFYDQKPKEGRLMSTDGKTLEKMGMGGQEIARWVNGKIKITAVSDVKSTETILKYMRASIPKNNFEEFVNERDYRKEYDNYQGKPEQIARRSSRNQARRIMGDKAEEGKDVGHKDNNPMNNDPKNLRNEDPSKNRREPRLRKKMESFVGFATESVRNDIHNGSIMAGIELEKYAKKSGGIDKADMLATAAILKKGKLPPVSKIPDDTDPRDKVYSIIGKHLNKKYLKKYKGDSPSFDSYLKEQWELDERKLTPTEIKRREEIAQELDDDKFKKRYGDDWKSVKMGVATNMAKKESFDVWFEARYKYKIDHKTYTSAVEEALLVADKAGYEVDMDDYFNQIATGPRKPSEGKTNTFKIGLEKGGKEQKKRLQIQIYGKGKHGYELNCYIQ